MDLRSGATSHFVARLGPILALVSTVRMVSAKTGITGAETSQPGSPGQPRVAPYQRDSPYLSVPPDLGVGAVGVDVVGFGEVVEVAAVGEEVVGGDEVVGCVEEVVVLVLELEQPARSILEIARTKTAMTRYFFMLPSRLYFRFACRLLSRVWRCS